MKKKIRKRNGQHQRRELLEKGTVLSFDSHLRRGDVVRELKQSFANLSRRKQPAEPLNQSETDHVQFNPAIQASNNVPSNSFFPGYSQWPMTHPTQPQHPQTQQYTYSSHQFYGGIAPNHQPIPWSNCSTFSCYRCSTALNFDARNFFSCSSCSRPFCFTCVNTYYNPIQFTCESCYLNNTLRTTQL